MTPVDNKGQPFTATPVLEVIHPHLKNNRFSSILHSEEIDEEASIFQPSDSKSVVNQLSHLSVESINVLGLLKPSTPRTTKMDQQDPADHHSSNLSSKYTPLSAKHATESLVPDPLRLNNPGTTIDRPAHLSWMDNPDLFADVSQDMNPVNEGISSLELSNDQIPVVETQRLTPEIIAAAINTRKKVAAASNLNLNKKNPLATVLTASHRLQSHLGIHNPRPWPNPPVPSDPVVGLGLIQKNGALLKVMLHACSNYMVDYNRKSEKKEFLDKAMLDLSMKDTDEDGNRQHEASFSKASEIHGQTYGLGEISNIVLTNSGVDRNKSEYGRDDKKTPEVRDQISKETMNATKTENEVDQHDGSFPTDAIKMDNSVNFPTRVSSLANAQAGNLSTCNDGLVGSAQGKSLLLNPTESGKLGKNFKTDEDVNPLNDKDMGQSDKIEQICWAIAVPEPLYMRSTFTNAIGQQQEFRVIPVLSLSLKDTAPSMLNSSGTRSELLLHLEVGLDGVLAICQGHAKIMESLQWKENVREERLGKLGTVRSGDGGFSKELLDHEIKEGKGQGWWIFFGVSLRQTDAEKANGKGGKWACWGLPMEACSPVTVTKEVAFSGGGKDDEGKDVPKHEINVHRVEFVSSTGGVAAMDLWQGAKDWKEPAWGRIKDSMAKNGLKASFLVSAKSTEAKTTDGGRRRKNKRKGPKAKRSKGNTTSA